MDDPRLRSKWWRLTHLYKILDKQGNLVTFKPNLPQTLHLWARERSKVLRLLLVKARQFGFTTLYAIDLLDDACFVPGMSCAILAHEREAVDKIFEIVKRAYENMPEELKPVTRRDTLRTYRFATRFDGVPLDSTIYVALKLRSTTVLRLHITEGAYIRNRQELEAGGATSRYLVNALEDGTGADLTASVTVSSVAVLGTSYRITFSNSNSSPVYVTQLLLYGTPAKVVEQIEERYIDQTSIDTYGRNPGNNGEPLVIDNDLIQEYSTAHSLAYTLVQEYKDPHRRYEAPIFANPALQIGDFLSVTNADTAETKDMYLTGYKTTRGRNGELRQTVELEERTIQSYFTIGTSLIGGSDSIAP